MASIEVNGTQAVAKSLRILQVLTDADRPITSADIAAAVGMPQPSVRRMLSSLRMMGFVRKVDYRHFTLDFGLVYFATRGALQYPHIAQAMPAFERMLPAIAAWKPVLATTWWGWVVVLLQGTPQGETTLLPCNRYPLHCSASGLRLIADMPDEQALSWLGQSMTWTNGWRPTPRMPATPEAMLARVRESIADDVLLMEGWVAPDRVKTAIPVRVAGAPVAALTFFAPVASDGYGGLLQRLRGAARELEAALARPAPELPQRVVRPYQ